MAEPAGVPAAMRARLAGSRLYLCTGARRSTGDLAEFLDAVLGAGVDIVQLREKGLEAREELGLLEVFADACRRHGRLLAVNDRADVALAARSDVLHLGQDDLPVPVARRILGPGPLIGRSSHSPAQADAAASEPGVDYFCACRAASMISASHNDSFAVLDVSTAAITSGTSTPTTSSLARPRRALAARSSSSG